MPPARVRSVVEPRVYGNREMAQFFNRGVTWWSENRRNLESEGMPAFDPLLGGWDAKAVNAWLDQRAGLISDTGSLVRQDRTDAWLRAANGED